MGKMRVFFFGAARKKKTLTPTSPQRAGEAGRDQPIPVERLRRRTE
jgi:hypothetical protein